MFDGGTVSGPAIERAGGRAGRASGRAAAPVGQQRRGGQLTQLVLGLLLVVGLIFVLAWLLRRVQRVGPAATAR